MSIKCRHEAWEESPGGDRKCADCREWLEPVPPKAHTADFQVGDRVSVEGVVTRVNHITLDVQSGLFEFYVPQDRVTIVERAKRKLRVGSVWERRLTPNSEMFDRYVWTGATFVSPNGDNYSREGRDLDTHPHHWREVPVEELEREAGS